MHSVCARIRTALELLVVLVSNPALFLPTNPCTQSGKNFTAQGGPRGGIGPNFLPGLRPIKKFSLAPVAPLKTQGGGVIEPPKTGGFREKGSIDRTIDQLF